MIPLGNVKSEYKLKSFLVLRSIFYGLSWRNSRKYRFLEDEDDTLSPGFTFP